MPQVPWPNCVTGFALQMISSACHTLCLSVIGLHSFQMFWPDFLFRQGWELYSAQSQAVTQLPCLDGGDQAPELAKLFEDLDQADLHSTEFPGQTVPLPWLCR